MKIKGEFRDVLSRNGEIIEDRGWRSNTIVEEFGNFLAAVMKKDFQDLDDTIKPVGIEYMAVGSKSKNVDEFKSRVENFFSEWNKNSEFDSTKPRGDPGDPWIWVKKIDSGNITYLGAPDINQVTNMLQISVDFSENEPKSDQPRRFEEFALLGILRKSNDKFETSKMFFINHATHGIIDKAASVTITRTVNLTFPVNQEVVA